MKRHYVAIILTCLISSACWQTFAEKPVDLEAFEQIKKEVEKKLTERFPEGLDELIKNPTIQYRIACASMLFSVTDDSLDKEAMDFMKAIDWLRLSAQSGNKDAQSVLKNLLENAESIAKRELERLEQ